MSVLLFHVLSIGLCLNYLLASDSKDVCNVLGAEVWNYVACDETYVPQNCSREKIIVNTLDEFDRCGPSYISTMEGRNYFLGVTGKGETFNDNRKAFKKIKILPKGLVDVSRNSTNVTILGTEIDYPIGVCPNGMLKLAHPEGELARVSGLADRKTILIMSTYATNTIEEVAERANGTSVELWMHVYFLKNFTKTEEIVRRAVESGFKKLVLTVDSNVVPAGKCGRKTYITLPPGVEVNNVGPDYPTAISNTGTFEDITRVKNMTNLPVIAKGVLTGSDAIKAIKAGASAIIVSNHGGRQMEYAPASIDALPFVVDAVNKYNPEIEVYMDGGVRDGYDVYKALARGAKMVFLGRPFIWGLAFNGSSGVRKVYDIITSEFQEVMTLSGHTRPDEIKRDTLLPQLPTF